jgi:hypothetical protein
VEMAAGVVDYPWHPGAAPSAAQRSLAALQRYFPCFPGFPSYVQYCTSPVTCGSAPTNTVQPASLGQLTTAVVGLTSRRTPSSMENN